MHTLELMNPKVLIQLDQADKSQRKNGIIGEEWPTNLEKFTKVSPGKTPQSSLKTSILGGQDRNKGAGSTRTSLTGCRTGLTSHPRNSKNKSQCKNTVKPSFEEHMAKYEKKRAIHKQKNQPNTVKSTKSSPKSREQPDSYLHQGNSATILIVWISYSKILVISLLLLTVGLWQNAYAIIYHSISFYISKL